MATSMEPLCRTRHLARLLLACFAMALGVAMLSPLVRTQGMERVCTAAGEARWVAAGGNDAAAQDGQAHGLECVLCLPAMLPPATTQARAAAQSLPQHPASPLRQAHVPPLSRAAFPPRGPPVWA